MVYNRLYNTIENKDSLPVFKKEDKENFTLKGSLTVKEHLNYGVRVLNPRGLCLEVSWVTN